MCSGERGSLLRKEGRFSCVYSTCHPVGLLRSMGYWKLRNEFKNRSFINIMIRNQRIRPLSQLASTQNRRDTLSVCNRIWVSNDKDGKSIIFAMNF